MGAPLIHHNRFLVVISKKVQFLEIGPPSTTGTLLFTCPVFCCCHAVKSTSKVCSLQLKVANLYLMTTDRTQGYKSITYDHNEVIGQVTSQSTVMEDYNIYVTSQTFLFISSYSSGTFTAKAPHLRMVSGTSSQQKHHT